MRNPSMPHDQNMQPALVGVEATQDQRQHKFHDQQSSQNGFNSPESGSIRAGTPPQPVRQSDASATDNMEPQTPNHPQQPINDVVTSAVNTADSNLSPEMIDLITKNVIKQLKDHMNVPGTSAQPVQPPERTPLSQGDGGSSVHGMPRAGRISYATKGTATYDTPHLSHPSIATGLDKAPQTVPPTSSSNVFMMNNTRCMTPFSQGSNEEEALSDAESRSRRPSALRRQSTDPDATVIEKKWGKLFDADGQGTAKLQSFLRGIALYLIDNFDPKHSLVITPDKLQRFYEQTKLQDHQEIYPWHLVFDDKTSSISRLLRDPDIKVEHHLIQSALDARPEIPGLTPSGFASWMTLLIRAHPDHEHERLDRALRIMAINHPEEKDRFPAVLPRRLFPDAGNESIASKLVQLMAVHCKVQVPSRNGSVANPLETPQSPKKSEPPPAPTVEDAVDESESTKQNRSRDQQVDAAQIRTAADAASAVHKADSVTSIEDDSDSTPRLPIERERNPYVVQPGLGKFYEAVSSGDERIDRSEHGDVPEATELRRTKSTSGPGRPHMPPPIAIYQRTAQPQYPPPEMADINRARTATFTGGDESSRHRTRSNSSYAGETKPFRRTRSNSTYANEASTRYHPQRSPSYQRTMDIPNPRATAPGGIEYGSFTSHGATSPGAMERASYSSAAYPPPPERYSYSSSYESRDPRYSRERSRDRHRPQGTVSESHFPPDEHYRQQASYINGNGVHPNAAYQYPPSAYRDGGR